MNKHFGKLFGLVFLICLVSNVFALTGFESNKCNLVELDAGMVSLEKSSEENGFVSVHNSAGEPFYLEQINVVDDVSGVMVYTRLNDKTILPYESKAFTVRVRTLENVAFGRHSLVLEAKGHFLGGDVCGFNELRTELAVEVFREEVQLAESGSGEFVLNVVEKLNISEDEEISSVLLNIDNGLNERVEVRLAGENLSLYTNYISVPSNTQIQRMVYFSAKADNTVLVVNPSCEDCDLEATRVEIVRGEEEVEETVEQEETEEGDVFLPGIGLVSLGQATLLAGILVLAILLGFYLYTEVIQKQGKKETKAKK